MRRRVTHEVDFAVPDLPADGHPASIDGNARALPFERLEMLSFEKAFEAAFGVAAVFADHAKCGAFRGFGD